MTSTLILPAAGLATRIGGIPKFLLPDRSGRSLLSAHVSSADGLDRIIVVTRPELREFVLTLLEHQVERTVDVLAASTATMSETVHFALEASPQAGDFVVGLPDTAVLPGVPYLALSHALGASDVTIAAYPTRPDQAGRLGALRLEGSRCVEVRDKDQSAANWTHHWGALGFRRATFERFSDPGHPHIGFALQRGVVEGIDALVAHFGTEYFDLGTLDELTRYFRGAPPDEAAAAM